MMGNFKPPVVSVGSSKTSPRRRSILRGSVGRDGKNLPSDLRLISTAFSGVGLLSADASSKDISEAIAKAVHHIRKTGAVPCPDPEHPGQISPADETERAMRRAIAELRYPIRHRAAVLSAAPKGARAIVDCGMALARTKADQAHCDEQPRAFRRAILPPLSPQAFQDNQRVVDAHLKSRIDHLDRLIALSIRDRGRQGFVEIRAFFADLRAKNPEVAEILASKTKRHLRGKPQRRFAKLIGGVPPNDDDFEDQIS